MKTGEGGRYLKMTNNCGSTVWAKVRLSYWPDSGCLRIDRGRTRYHYWKGYSYIGYDGLYTC